MRIHFIPDNIGYDDGATTFELAYSHRYAVELHLRPAQTYYITHIRLYDEGDFNLEQYINNTIGEHLPTDLRDDRTKARRILLNFTGKVVERQNEDEVRQWYQRSKENAISIAILAIASCLNAHEITEYKWLTEIISNWNSSRFNKEKTIQVIQAIINQAPRLTFVVKYNDPTINMETKEPLDLAVISNTENKLEVRIVEAGLQQKQFETFTELAVETLVPCFVWVDSLDDPIDPLFVKTILQYVKSIVQSGLRFRIPLIDPDTKKPFILSKEDSNE